MISEFLRLEKLFSLKILKIRILVLGSEEVSLLTVRILMENMRLGVQSVDTKIRALMILLE